MKKLLDKEIIIAAKNFDIDKVLDLIKKGANINVEQGIVLKTFSDFEHIDSVKKLLKISNITVSFDDYSVIFFAIHNNNFELFKLLMEHEKIPDLFISRFLCRSVCQRNNSNVFFNYLFNNFSFPLTYKNNIIFINSLKYNKMSIALKLYSINEVKIICNDSWKKKYLINDNIKKNFNLLNNVVNF